MSFKPTGVIIWCHGGCFGGGNATYDSTLRYYLIRRGYKVVSMDFPTDDYQKAKSYIRRHITVLKREYPQVPIIMGGVSSGGFLAHQLANEFHIPAALICPVIKPFDRHNELDEKNQMLQLRFFHTLDEMKKAQDEVGPPNAGRFIIYGRDDHRAPYSAYQSWINKNEIYVCFVSQSGGHELCRNPPMNLFAQGIDDMIKNYFKFNGILYE